MNLLVFLILCVGSALASGQDLGSCPGGAHSLAESVSGINISAMGFYPHDLEVVERSGNGLRGRFVGVVQNGADLEPRMRAVSDELADRIASSDYSSVSADGTIGIAYERMIEDVFQKIDGAAPPERIRELLVAAIKEQPIRLPAFSDPHFFEARVRKVAENIRLDKQRLRVLAVFQAHEHFSIVNSTPIQRLYVSEEAFNGVISNGVARTTIIKKGVRRLNFSHSPSQGEYDRTQLRRYVSTAANAFWQWHQAKIEQALLLRRNPISEFSSEIKSAVENLAGPVPAAQSLMREILTGVFNVPLPSPPDARRIAARIQGQLEREKSAVFASIQELNRPIPSAPSETTDGVIQGLVKWEPSKGSSAQRPFRERTEKNVPSAPEPKVQVAEEPDYSSMDPDTIHEALRQYGASASAAKKFLDAAEYYRGPGHERLFAESYRILWQLNNGRALELLGKKVRPTQEDRDILEVYPFGSANTLRIFLGKGQSGRYYLLELEINPKSGAGAREADVITRLSRKWRPQKPQM